MNPMTISGHRKLITKVKKLDYRKSLELTERPKMSCFEVFSTFLGKLENISYFSMITKDHTV